MARKGDLTEGGGAHRLDTMNTGPAWNAATRRGIEQALETALAAQPATEVVRAARYVTQGGGHRWRGLMAVAAGAIFREDATACVLPLAAALELMHAATLTLDDLPSMDNAETRRGQPCVHRVFPGWVTDMLPVFLVNLAYQQVAEIAAAPADGRLRCLALLGVMGGRLAQGQEQDLALARAGVSESGLLESYALKSGALFAAALAGGALLCGAEEAAAQALSVAGVQLGQAFQILDDIADGDSEAGRSTAVTVLGRAGARARADQLLAEVSHNLDGFGSAADALRGVLGEIRAPGAG